MDMIAFLSHFHTDCLSVGSFSLKITNDCDVSICSAKKLFMYVGLTCPGSDYFTTSIRAVVSSILHVASQILLMTCTVMQ